MNKSNHRKYNWELAPTYSEDVKLYGTVPVPYDDIDIFDGFFYLFLNLAARRV